MRPSEHGHRALLSWPPPSPPQRYYSNDLGLSTSFRSPCPCHSGLNLRRDIWSALEDLAKAGETDPHDGVVIDHFDPQNGGPSTSTLHCRAQLLGPGEETRSHRHMCSTVYFVVRGSGETLVGKNKGEEITLRWGDGIVSTVRLGTGTALRIMPRMRQRFYFLSATGHCFKRCVYSVSNTSAPLIRKPLMDDDFIESQTPPLACAIGHRETPTRGFSVEKPPMFAAFTLSRLAAFCSSSRGILTRWRRVIRNPGLFNSMRRNPTLFREKLGEITGGLVRAGGCHLRDIGVVC